MRIYGWIIRSGVYPRRVRVMAPTVQTGKDTAQSSKRRTGCQLITALLSVHNNTGTYIHT